ncbi:formin-like protein 20 isoform X3 [Vigna unguiculata]|uniref:formin-like protein 20 isoform X3 n=1 Tax=Vigna unguiculata TaxID=3917 RepID=UPI001015D122|nr:formin-like protein 20 isoform X3 [Vigna unguiculata]
MAFLKGFIAFVPFLLSSLMLHHLSPTSVISAQSDYVRRPSSPLSPPTQTGRTQSTERDSDKAPPPDTETQNEILNSDIIIETILSIPSLPSPPIQTTQAEEEALSSNSNIQIQETSSLPSPSPPPNQINKQSQMSPSPSSTSIQAQEEDLSSNSNIEVQKASSPPPPSPPKNQINKELQKASAPPPPSPPKNQINNQLQASAPPPPSPPKNQINKQLQNTQEALLSNSNIEVQKASAPPPPFPPKNQINKQLQKTQESASNPLKMVTNNDTMLHDEL